MKTEVIPGVDANGKKILNYKVGYQYEVINKEFSAKEDFPSGGYNIERSNAAMSLMKIIKNAFEGDFAKYLSEGKQVKVIITGSADAARFADVWLMTDVMENLWTNLITRMATSIISQSPRPEESLRMNSWP